MAAIAQQYYEEAAQNEQMGEEDEGVSTILFYCAHPDERDPPWQCIRAEAVGRVHSLKYYFLLVIYMGG